MKKIIGIVAIVLIVAIAAGVLGYLTEGFKNWTFSDVLPIEENQEIVGELEIVAESTDYIDLVISDYKGPLMASPGGLSALSVKSVEATVMPEAAVDKTVDWFVFWGNPNSEFASGKDVREYVNVIPNSDGSRKAFVECYQAFGDEVIIIQVITRIGGFSATCNVTFSGRPQAITINVGMESRKNGTLDTYYLGTNSVYDFDISISNNFNSVGSQYNNYRVWVEGFGTITVDGCVETYSQGSTSVVWSGNEHNVELDSIKDSFLTVTISDGKVHVVTKCLIEDYYLSKSTHYYDVTYVDKYVRSNLNYGTLPGFSIWVEEITSGVRGSIYVGLEVMPQNVGLVPSNIDF